MSIMKEKLTASVLNFKHGHLDGDSMALLDMKAIDSSQLNIKNMCAKVSSELANKVADTSSWLGMSQRQFIEMSVINAIDLAEELAEEFNVTNKLNVEDSKK